MYTSPQLRRRFRVPLSLFGSLHNDLVAAYPETFRFSSKCNIKHRIPYEVEFPVWIGMLGSG